MKKNWDMDPEFENSLKMNSKEIESSIEAIFCKFNIAKK